jgi:hypothetical protein
MVHHLGYLALAFLININLMRSQILGSFGSGIFCCTWFCCGPFLFSNLDLWLKGLNLIFGLF